MDDQSTDSGTAARDDSERSASLTTVFDLLARGPRRQLLYWLHRHDDRTVTLDALVQRLEEYGSTGPADDSSSLRVSLHHVHLPKLDDAEVVDYDREKGEVRYRGDPRLADLIEWGICEETLE